MRSSHWSAPTRRPGRCSTTCRRRPIQCVSTSRSATCSSGCSRWFTGAGGAARLRRGTQWSARHGVGNRNRRAGPLLARIVLAVVGSIVLLVVGAAMQAALTYAVADGGTARWALAYPLAQAPGNTRGDRDRRRRRWVGFPAVVDRLGGRRVECIHRGVRRTAQTAGVGTFIQPVGPRARCRFQWCRWMDALDRRGNAHRRRSYWNSGGAGGDEAARHRRNVVQTTNSAVDRDHVEVTIHRAGDAGDQASAGASSATGDEADLAALVDVGDLHAQLRADVHDVLDLVDALAPCRAWRCAPGRRGPGAARRTRRRRWS